MGRTHSLNVATMVAVMLGLIFSAAFVTGQGQLMGTEFIATTLRQRNESSNEAIRNALLWWLELPKSADFHDLTPDVNAALMQFTETSGKFRSRLRRPSDRRFEMDSAFFKKQGLER